jgi:hypothetical protein
MKEKQEIQLSPGVPRRLFLSPKETSLLIGRAEQSLANDRCAGRGLPYVKLGRSVRYKISDVLAYTEARRIDPEARG